MSTVQMSACCDPGSKAGTEDSCRKQRIVAWSRPSAPRTGLPRVCRFPGRGGGDD